MIDGMCFDNKNELINELNRKIQIKNYKHYFNPKILCEKNKFEFLIFDKEKRTFNIHEKNDTFKT